MYSVLVAWEKIQFHLLFFFPLISGCRQRYWVEGKEYKYIGFHIFIAFREKGKEREEERERDLSGLPPKCAPARD